MLNAGSGKVHFPDGWVHVDRRTSPDRPWVIGADLRGLPFRDSAFDGALASHVLEHIVEVDSAVRELHRVLKPDARLVVRVPWGLAALLDPFHVRAFDFSTMRRFCAEDPHDPEYVRLFNIESQRVTDYHLPVWLDFLMHSPKIHERFRKLVPLLFGFRVRFPESRLINRYPLTRRKELTCVLRTVKFARLLIPEWMFK